MSSLSPLACRMLLDLWISVWLAVHLICVDVAMAAPLLMLVLDRRASQGDLTAAELTPKIGRLAVKTLLLGGVVGLLYGLGFWSEHYAAAIQATGSRWQFAIAEYFFSLLLIAIAWRLAVRAYPAAQLTPEAFRGSSSRGWWLRALLLFAAGTNLIYHFPLFFEVLAQLRRGPLPETTLTSAEFRGLMSQPQIVARSLHVVLASFAVVGVMLAWMCQRRHFQVSAHRQVGALRWYRFGMHLALWPTAIQLAVGFWVLVTLPRTVMLQLSGESVTGVVAASLAMTAVAGLFHGLIRGLVARNSVAYGFSSMLWMLLTVWAMCWMSRVAGN